MDSNLRKGLWAKVKEECQRKLEIELEKMNAEREYLTKIKKSRYPWTKATLKNELKEKKS